MPILLLLGLLFSASGCSTNISSLASSSEPVSSGKASSSASSSKSSSSSKGTSSAAPSSEEQSESAPTSSEAPSSQAPSSEAPSSQAPSSADTSVAVSIPEQDAHWDLDFTEYGTEFIITLGKQIKASGKLGTKSGALSIGAKAAAYPNENSSTFIPFYHAPKDSEKTTTSACNREHTWPDSRGGGSKAGGSEVESDPIMLRPTLTDDNSSRGNKFYGTGSSEWDPASCGYEAARGESARVILYTAACYYESHGLTLSNNPNDGTSKKTMGTLKTLLKWNRDYAPSDFEKLVNERYDKMGYRRNPFVDHPEYANWIWDDNGFRTTPYGGDVPTPTPGSSEVTSRDDAKALNLVTDLSNLDGKSLVITGTNSGTVYALTDQEKSETLPWYLVGTEVTVENGKLYSESDLVYFTFDEVQEDTYNISTSDGRFLYGYTAGTHYSIGLVKTEQEIRDAQSGTTISKISKDWKVVPGDNGELQMIAAESYLEYYKGSFCGYNKTPNDPIMLFA